MADVIVRGSARGFAQQITCSKAPPAVLGLSLRVRPHRRVQRRELKFAGSTNAKVFRLLIRKPNWRWREFPLQRFAHLSDSRPILSLWRADADGFELAASGRQLNHRIHQALAQRRYLGVHGRKFGLPFRGTEKSCETFSARLRDWNLPAATRTVRERTRRRVRVAGG